MGIQGLLPFLKAASKETHISEFRNCTVAVDTYCWLHKGAFGCAEELAMDKPTNVYVTYCMKFVRMLLHSHIKPILVFDGQDLPAKADIEKKRRQNREANKLKGRQLFAEGRRGEARECFERCTNVTEEMAMSLMKSARELGVDCLVAPYEADAQLAYLNHAGIADLIVTEDSDLLLFACSHVLFKLTIDGRCTLVEKDKLHEPCGFRPGSFSFEKFRYMCILAGCDYFPGIPGIGLSTAAKIMQRTRLNTLKEILDKLNLYVASKISGTVTPAMRTQAIEADMTFLYQVVFDPLTGKRRHLQPLPDHLTTENVKFAGEIWDDKLSQQMAFGNLHFSTMKIVGHFNPRNEAYLQLSQTASHQAATTSSLSKSHSSTEVTGRNTSRELAGMLKSTKKTTTIESQDNWHFLSIWHPEYNSRKQPRFPRVTETKSPSSSVNEQKGVLESTLKRCVTVTYTVERPQISTASTQSPSAKRRRYEATAEQEDESVQEEQNNIVSTYMTVPDTMGADSPEVWNRTPPQSPVFHKPRVLTASLSPPNAPLGDYEGWQNTTRSPSYSPSSSDQEEDGEDKVNTGRFSLDRVMELPSRILKKNKLGKWEKPNDCVIVKESLPSFSSWVKKMRTIESVPVPGTTSSFFTKKTCDSLEGDSTEQEIVVSSPSKTTDDEENGGSKVNSGRFSLDQPGPIQMKSKWEKPNSPVKGSGDCVIVKENLPPTSSVAVPGARSSFFTRKMSDCMEEDSTEQEPVSSPPKASRPSDARVSGNGMNLFIRQMRVPLPTSDAWQNREKDVMATSTSASKTRVSGLKKPLSRRSSSSASTSTPSANGTLLPFMAQFQYTGKEKLQIQSSSKK